MRLLADESCDFSVVRALRGAGHDVIAVVELFPSLDDSLILDLAFREQRVLLTEDKDFGSWSTRTLNLRAESFSFAIPPTCGQPYPTPL